MALIAYIGYEHEQLCSFIFVIVIVIIIGNKVSMIRSSAIEISLVENSSSKSHQTGGYCFQWNERRQTLGQWSEGLQVRRQRAGDFRARLYALRLPAVTVASSAREVYVLFSFFIFLHLFLFYLFLYFSLFECRSIWLILRKLVDEGSEDQGKWLSERGRRKKEQE